MSIQYEKQLCQLKSNSPGSPLRGSVSSTNSSIMKCETFCLLAFWAFEAVFARDAFKEPEYTHEGTANKFNDAIFKLDSPVLAASFAVKGLLGTTDLMNICISEAENHNAFHQKYTASVAKCEKCYQEAEKTKDFKVADTCCDKAVAAFVVVNKLKNDRAMACIKKCEELGKDCQEMLRKLSPKDAKQISGLE
ncbi:uncharacterized protein LOC117169975 [Belonocnema kinseyi]|uniref:uncharacterized protein LOC117169975 n=1 Tax=Belonocnema kinseyi TaxID=2817044 RepID=UPI00143D379E|nr:uncharacterized protein LOC117169975 [Belonocnema kinseyi]